MYGRRALIGEVVTPGGGARRAAVIVRDGRISGVIEQPFPTNLPDDRREVSGLICPGFIDLQVNGAFGISVGPDKGRLEGLARKLVRTGTTSFLPTAMSWPVERYGALLGALEATTTESGAQILGAHLEGPFLSPECKGAHDPDNLRPVDLGLLKEVLSTGRVRVMTLAPELAGAGRAAELLRASGAVASVGHTSATYEEVSRGLDAGFSKATHLYNAMSPFGHRAPGAVGAILTDERARAGIIPDGIHVHPGALRLAYKAKGVGGLTLVTDATEAAGMPDGEYELGGRQVRSESGSVRLPDGTLAGSAFTMDEAVRQAARLLGIPLDKAVRLASETPATVLGLPEKGKIAPGADADLVILTPEGFVQETIVAGETVYRRERGPRSR